MNDGTESARPPRRRIGALAVIRDESGAVLVVQPRHRQGWNLPGGRARPDEMPHVACAREVLEETGLSVDAVRLLALDYVPADAEDGAVEAYNFVYDGGTYPVGTAVTVRREQVSAYAWVPPGDLAGHAEAPQERRIRAALAQTGTGETASLVRGHPVAVRETP